MLQKIKNEIVESQIFKSVFRHGYPDNDLDRAYAIFSSVIHYCPTSPYNTFNGSCINHLCHKCGGPL